MKENQTIFAMWISFTNFISIIYTKEDPLDTITRVQKRQRGFDKTIFWPQKEFENITNTIT